MLRKIVTNATFAAVALSVLSGNVQAAGSNTVPVRDYYVGEWQACGYPVFWMFYKRNCPDGEVNYKKIVKKHERDPNRGSHTSGGHDRGDKGGRSPNGAAAGKP